jgi:predicted site-specific integrase-resolvase
MWIRASQAADRLGLSPQAVRNLLRAGKLAGQQRDGRWMVEESSVRAYLETHGRRPSATNRLAQLQGQVDELTRTVEQLVTTDSPRSTLQALERERDHHRADAVAANAALRLTLASGRATREAVSQLLEALRAQEEALVQQLVPGLLDEGMTPSDR